jgi:RNA polymerase sigma-70 factor, ECF subfamily
MNQPVNNPTAQAEDIAAALTAAHSGNAEDFSQLVEPYRRELRAHCYRMTSSLEDAEDLVQETFLRAWRRRSTYAGRASLRAWLYKIATNACLDALKRLPRRTLPLDAGERDSPGAGEEPAWVEPFPEAWLAPNSASPEARYDAYESISLAFLVALQVLPPRQRSALVFADVLDWSTADTAAVLGVSVSAVTSLLRRARVTMQERNQAGRLDRSRLGLPADQTRQLLDRYARAWEAADLDAIIAMLAEDASFPMPPMLAPIQGRQAMAEFYAAYVFDGDVPRRWKLVPIQASGRPGFAFYRLDEAAQVYQAYVLQLLTIENGLVTNATSFGFPALFRYFDLPPVYSG